MMVELTEKFRFIRDDVFLYPSVDTNTGRQMLILQKIDLETNEVEFEDGIDCIHTAVTEISTEEFEDYQNDANIQEQLNKRTLEIRSSEELTEINLTPEEKFTALKSWTAGIAEAGLNAFRIQDEIDKNLDLLYPISHFLFKFMIKVDRSKFLMQYLTKIERDCMFEGKRHDTSLIANLIPVLNILIEDFVELKESEDSKASLSLSKVYFTAILQLNLPWEIFENRTENLILFSLVDKEEIIRYFEKVGVNKFIEMIIKKWDSLTPQYIFNERLSGLFYDSIGFITASLIEIGSNVEGIRHDTRLMDNMLLLPNLMFNDFLELKGNSRKSKKSIYFFKAFFSSFLQLNPPWKFFEDKFEYMIFFSLIDKKEILRYIEKIGVKNFIDFYTGFSKNINVDNEEHRLYVINNLFCDSSGKIGTYILELDSSFDLIRKNYIYIDWMSYYYPKFCSKYIFQMEKRCKSDGKRDDSKFILYLKELFDGILASYESHYDRSPGFDRGKRDLLTAVYNSIPPRNFFTKYPDFSLFLTYPFADKYIKKIGLQNFRYEDLTEEDANTLYSIERYNIGNPTDFPEDKLKWSDQLYFPISGYKEKNGHVIELNLSGDLFLEIPGELSNLKYLEKISLVYDLKPIPDTFGEIISLKDVEIWMNENEEFPKCLFSLKNLEKLRIEQNNCKILPDGFKNLKNLKELRIGLCNFNIMPDSICQFSNLELFDLNNNHIEKLLKPFGNLSKL